MFTIRKYNPPKVAGKCDLDGPNCTNAKDEPSRDG